MSERSGLSDLDVAVLGALADMGARRDRSHVKSARALDELYACTGIPPLYGYEVMCNLAAPWLVNLRLLDPHGNYGSPDFSAASPRYTEVRLSEIGMLAIAAERGDGPPVPIGLINGDVHLDGRNPPFNPTRLTETLASLVEDGNLSDDALVRSVGTPDFPTGCAVDGDIDGLAAGDLVRLTLRACLSHETIQTPAGDRNAIVVSSLPPKGSVGEVAWYIKQRAEEPRWEPDHRELADQVRLPIADVRDETSGTLDGRNTRLVVVLKSDADPGQVEEMLGQIWGIKVEVNAHLRAPLAVALRDWVDRFRGEDLLAGLTRLGALV